MLAQALGAASVTTTRHNQTPWRVAQAGAVGVCRRCACCRCCDAVLLTESMCLIHDSCARMPMADVGAAPAPPDGGPFVCSSASSRCFVSRQSVLCGGMLVSACSSSSSSSSPSASSDELRRFSPLYSECTSSKMLMSFCPIYLNCNC